MEHNHNAERKSKSFKDRNHLVAILFSLLVEVKDLREIRNRISNLIEKLCHVAISLTPIKSTSLYWLNMSPPAEFCRTQGEASYCYWTMTDIFPCV